jgi:hypothetical protein
MKFCVIKRKEKREDTKERRKKVTEEKQVGYICKEREKCGNREKWKRRKRETRREEEEELRSKKQEDVIVIEGAREKLVDRERTNENQNNFRRNSQVKNSLNMF